MKLDTTKHTVTIPADDYHELIRPQHKELQKYLDKLEERFNIRIKGIDLTDTPTVCNKHKSGDITIIEF